MSDGPAMARILIVDDDRLQVQALCDTLRRNHDDPMVVTTPAGALAAVRKARFELLLAGLSLAGTDGVTLLRAAGQLDPDLVGLVVADERTMAAAGERDLRDLQDRLRDRTAEREAAIRELEVVSYAVSHDLRAPLRAVSGFSRILREEFAPGMPEEARDLLEHVVQAASKMEQLIDGLLGLSRVSRHLLVRQAVDVQALVADVVDELRRAQPDRRVDVRAGDLPVAHADPVLLRQVFLNLLSNAFKFSRRAAAARVEVSCRCEHEGNVYCVRDNGAGFDMQYAAKLFGIFQRLHRDTEFEGAGVGLAIVQRIVQRHGGRIRAEAAVDQGASFSFTLGA